LVVFAPPFNFMIPPSVFGGRDGFVRRHGIRLLATLSLQVGSLFVGMLPSQIGVLEKVQAWAMSQP
jgi:hypothetical protein